MTPFDLGPGPSDRSRFAAFGRIVRRAQYLALADPSLAAPLLLVLSEDVPGGAIFFSLGAGELPAPVSSESPDHDRS
jgi:hypothetical protein